MNILLACDGSPNALRAAHWVADLANSLKRPPNVVVINVHDDLPYRNAERFIQPGQVREILAEQSERDSIGVLNVLRNAGIVPIARYLVGPVAKTILEVAGSEQCDLLVMGQKGRSAVANLLMGSVSTHVLAGTRTPVVLVK